jgi:hypothetical protein
LPRLAGAHGRFPSLSTRSRGGTPVASVLAADRITWPAEEELMNGAEASANIVPRLRNALHAARANPEIRKRLEEIVDDPERFDPIVNELGARHALVLELLALVRPRERAA